MSVTPKEAARARVRELIRAFERNEADYVRAAYNETQTRTDFITPLLEAFGWDVHNIKGQPLALREVIEEATVEVGEERLSKRPDYELRLARQRKLFVEAKKPSVLIGRDRTAAFQSRRYGYSAGLPITILTNFHQLAIYDCVPVPAEADEAHVARLMLISYRDFDIRFDELWDLFSREAIYSGAFDRRFDITASRHGTEQFDDLFLHQVRDWRERLAKDVYANTPELSPEELTYVVQLFLTRIVFLRICEDREIERYETLKNLDTAGTFNALMNELRRADDFYDSGLFRLLDDQPLGVRISDDTLRSVINELYYPLSPYTFAVVETEVLGQIYEQFLGEVITIADGAVQIVSKPEVRESGGVVPTPRFIADAIVARTLQPMIDGRSPDDLIGFTVADICCGSGIFLLSAYELLLDHHLSWYLANNPSKYLGRRIYEAAAGQWRLTHEERRRILLTHLRGVDIDPNAVEVAQFSLLLKLIEGETAEDLRDFVRLSDGKALPALDNSLRSGNSLVSAEEWQAACGPMPRELADKIKPFSWSAEFPELVEHGGFDAIVGNPPYIRIQNMASYSPQETAYYRSATSPFTTGRQDNFDKYSLFIERSLSLTNRKGRIGLIVPHKFMTIQSGRALRRLLTQEHLLEEVVHFGVKAVFGPGTSNYTCILILNRQGSEVVRWESAGPLEMWRYGRPGELTGIPIGRLGEDPWEFVNEDTRALFARVRGAHVNNLESVAEILVGVQTSADDVYMLHPVNEDAATVTCRWNEQDWPVEKSILRPCLHDAKIRAYERVEANAWIIFPYEIVTDEKRRKRARLIQPQELADRYPLCWAYLNARRDELEDRSVTGGSTAERQWYQYGRSQSITKFDTPKIILPVLSIEPRYGYDERNTLITAGGNGPYYMVRARENGPISNHYLLAVLNHPLSEALIRTNTSTFRGGYYSHGKQFIKNLPIPTAGEADRSEIESLVARLIDAHDALNSTRTPHQRQLRSREASALKAEIERRVTLLFALSETDMDTIRAIPIPA